VGEKGEGGGGSEEGRKGAEKQVGLEVGRESRGYWSRGGRGVGGGVPPLGIGSPRGMRLGEGSRVRYGS